MCCPTASFLHTLRVKLERNSGYSLVFFSPLLSHEYMTWFILISLVTCSTFFQKCKAVLAKNTHIKMLQKLWPQLKNADQFWKSKSTSAMKPREEPLWWRTDFQKFTTVLFFARVCADVARQLKNRCKKQEALLNWALAPIWEKQIKM